MLTFIIDNEYSWGSADVTIEDEQEIIVDGNWGNLNNNITLQAPKITFKDGASIETTGKVSLEASKMFPLVGLSLWNQIATIVEAIQPRDTSITVGEGVHITGGSVSISARSGDYDALKNNPDGSPTLYGELVAAPWYGQIPSFAVNTGITILDGLSALPLSVLVKQPTAEITIATDAAIVSTTGDVTLTSYASADATGRALFSIVADKVTNQSSLGWAIGVSYTDAQATATLSGGASITSAGKVDIKTEVKNTAKMAAEVLRNQGLKPVKGNNVEVAAAITVLNSTSQIDVAAGSTISAESTVTIEAKATDTNNPSTKTSSTGDGLGAATITVGVGNATVLAIVNGTITAGADIVPAAMDFSPMFDVDFQTSSIRVAEDTTRETGDRVVYSTNWAGAIPGLVSGQVYYAIVAEDKRSFQLAQTKDDALAEKAIDFGPGYPTLKISSERGDYALPITRIDTSEHTISFDVANAPNGKPLFADGDKVTYTPLAGQFLGRSDDSGMLIGALEEGDYSITVVPNGPDDGPGVRVKLSKDGGEAVRFNTLPQFRAEDGTTYPIYNLDATSGFVDLNVPLQEGDTAGAGGHSPASSLRNGDRVAYVQSLGCRIPGLVDGTDYYCIVDPANPGIIRLAPSYDQAEADNPAVQKAAPTLVVGDRRIDIGDVQPGTGLVFTTDPALPDGTAVIYHEVAGKPVGGLVDGKTYYAYGVPNPTFDPAFPAYVVALRESPALEAAPVDLSLVQTMQDAAGRSYAIDGVDANMGLLSLRLDDPVAITAAGTSGLAGTTPTVDVVGIPAESIQLWNNATSGTFTVSLPRESGTVTTTAIAFNATPQQIADALNQLPDVSITAFGRGTYDDPWTFVGSGLLELSIDSTGLGGGGSWLRLTAEGMQRVSTQATGGTFTLSLDVNGTTRVTDPILFSATAQDVQDAINKVGNVSVLVRGTGTPDDPWVVFVRHQPLQTGDAIVFRDAWGQDAHGLLDGTTYYSVVSASEQSNAGSVIVGLSRSKADALEAIPVTVPLFTYVSFGEADLSSMTGVIHTLAAPEDVSSGITISATLTSTDTLAAGVAKEKKDKYTEGFLQSKQWLGWASTSVNTLVNAAGGLVGMVGEQFIKKARDEFKQSANGQVTEGAFTGALCINVFTVKNVVRAVVGSSARLVTTGKISVSSKTTENTSNKVNATVSREQNGNAFAIAVNIVDISNSTKTIVQSNARLSAAVGVSVTAGVVYPWQGQMTWNETDKSWSDSTDSERFLALLEKNTFTKVGDFLNGRLGVDKWFVNNWTYATAEVKAGADRNSKVFSCGGSFITYTNDTIARIEDGVHINQDEHVSGATQSVTVTSTADISQTTFAGNVFFSVKPHDLKSAEFQMPRGTVALGGMFGYMKQNNTTRAIIGGTEEDAHASLYAKRSEAEGPSLITYGNGGLSVIADTGVMVIQLAQSAAEATDWGVAGSLSWLDGGVQTTEAAIVAPRNDERKAVISARSGSSGNVGVTATDVSMLIPIAGAVLVSANKNVGVSSAVATLERHVTGRIGATEDEGDAMPVDVTAAGDISVTSTAGGIVVPVAIAARYRSGIPPAGQPNQAPAAVDGAWGLGVSGDYAHADVTDILHATVFTNGAITSKGEAEKKSLTVTAANTTILQAAAGAAAFSSGSNSGSFGLAGSGAVVVATSIVTAVVRGATIDGFSLTVTATNDRKNIGALAAGGSGGSATGGTNVSIIGSVSYVRLTTETTAKVEDVTGTKLSATNVSATTKDKIWSGAGVLSISKGTQAAGKYGIGTAVAITESNLGEKDPTTSATVTGSTLTLATGGLSVTASDETKAITCASGLLWADNQAITGSGIVATSAVVSHTSASIDNSTITLESPDACDVSVIATTALLLVAVSGDISVVAGKGTFNGGVATTVVNPTLDGSAKITKSKVSVKKGGVRVRSSSVNPDDDPEVEAILDDLYTPARDRTAIYSLAVGVVAGKTDYSLATSVCHTNATVGQTAAVEGGVGENDQSGITLTDGSLSVEAYDDASIYSGAGSISVAGSAESKAAIGAAIVSNRLDSTVTAQIVSSIVDARSAGNGGDVTVTAINAARISTAAVGGAYSKVAGVGTSDVFSQMTHTVNAFITGSADKGSTITATGDVTVDAYDRSHIDGGAGQVSFATGMGAGGAAAATNTIDSTVNAIVEWATVFATGAITVYADAEARVLTVTVGVSGAWGAGSVFAGAGSGSGNTLSRKVLAAVRNSSVASHDLSIEATDTSSIEAHAGTVAFQAANTDASAAVGVSAAVNTIGSKTDDEDKKSYVKASLEKSAATVPGIVTLTATAKPTIYAGTGAGAGAYSGGDEKTGRFSLAGAGSGNYVQMDVVAEIQGSTVTQSTTNSTTSELNLTATNEGAVTAIAGGIALAGGGKGSAVTIGAAAAVNDIVGKTTAAISASTISTTDPIRSQVFTLGTIDISARNTSSIQAYACGVAGTLSGQGTFAGVGSAALNTITSDTLATIESSTTGSEQKHVNAVTMTSTDSSSIVAGTGSLSVAFGTSWGGFSACPSYSLNEIGGSAKAIVDNSMVHAQGNVTITAEFAKSDDAVEPYNIYSVSVAGASAGGTSSVVAGQIALAGAGNRNTVEFTTQAQIVNSSTVNVGGTLSLTATDTSAIYSNAGGVGVAVAIGIGSSSTAVGVSVGAAEGHNIIDNTVESQIIDSEATAGNDVTLTASSTPEIESMAWGVAVDIAAAETAGGGTGSGAGAYNTITNTVTASIESAEVHAGHPNAKMGSVTLSAIDKPVVTADAGAGAGFLGVGKDGVGLAVGAVIVENTITDTVTARIGKSGGTAAKASAVTAANMVGINAASEADVTSLGVAVTSTTVIAGQGVGAAGSGGHGRVDITNIVTAEIAESSTVEAHTVAVTAVDSDRVDNTFGGGTLNGATNGGSMGVSLTDTTVANTVTATISSSRVTALDTLGEAGRVTVLVDGRNKITSMTVATAVSVLVPKEFELVPNGSAAGGHAFSTDNSTFTASATGASTVITATQLDVVSKPTRLKAISADAHGGSGGLGTIGAVLATATDNTTRTATIGNNVDLSEVDALLLQAIGRPDVTAKSIAVAVGGVAVLVNASTVKTTGTVEASTGDNVKMPKRLQIIADAVTKLEVTQTGANAGIFYGGATVSRAESGLRVTAAVGDRPVMPEGGMTFLQVASSNRDEETWVNAISGTGGGGGGAGTRGDLIDTTITESLIRGGTIDAGAISIRADRRNNYDIAVDSTNIGLVAGVGGTIARFETSATSIVDIAEGTTIVAADTVTIGTSNSIQHNGSTGQGNWTVNGAGGAVGASIVVSKSTVTVSEEAASRVDIGSNVRITSGTHPLRQPGGISIRPTADLTVHDTVHIGNLGLVVAGGEVRSVLQGTLKPWVSVGDSVHFSSRGQIVIGTTATVDSSTETAGWGGSVVLASIGAYAVSDVTVDQGVTFGTNATLRADGGISLNPGDDSTASAQGMALDATARVEVGGLIGVPVVKATSTLRSKSRLTFGDGANVASGQGLVLAARAVQPDVTALGEGRGRAFWFIPISSEDFSTRTASTTSTMDLGNGTFTAGRDNEVVIEIPNDRENTFTSTIRSNPDTLFGVPVSSAYRYVPDFNPRAYIDQAGYSSAVGKVLKDGVASGTVGAVTFAPLTKDDRFEPLVVSGGSVTIAANTFSGKPTINARVGRITINNESPDYLILGDMAIANVDGGKVTLRNNDDEILSDPKDWTINRSHEVPTITINQAYIGNAVDTGHGPAVFLAGAVENLGGTVAITNASGSFGQTGTIAAKSIEISTPNGVFAVDTPTKDWAAAGTPAAQFSASMQYLVMPRDATANHKVMYAVNAMYPDSANWGAIGMFDQKTRDQVLNEDNADFLPQGGSVAVWFGESAPGISPYGKNNHGTVKHVTKTARPDGAIDAYRLDSGSSENDSWVPLLQSLPIEGGSDAVASHSTTTAIQGQVIAINAKTVNVNGELVAGGAVAADQSVEFPASLQSELVAYQARYQSGDESVPTYDIPADQLGVSEQNDALIGATFDARTGQIILKDVSSTGGGRVSITGKIINTDALAGKIRVTGGAGAITVRNRTSLPLVLGNVQSSGGGSGQVSITDLNNGDVTQQQTTYVAKSGEILVYKGAADADLPLIAAPRMRISGTETTFNPQPNIRWQWTVSTELSRAVSWNTTARSWDGINAGEWQAGDASISAAGEVVVGSTDMPAMHQRLAARVQATREFPTNYSFTTFNADFPDVSRWKYPTNIRLDEINSVRADWPIGIDFSGMSSAGVTVQSVGTVVLAGSTVAQSVTIKSKGAVSSLFAGASIDTTDLTLSGDSGVGGTGAPIRVSAATLNLSSERGSIIVDARRTDAAVDVTLNSAVAPYGTVSIIVPGSMRAGTGVAGGATHEQISATAATLRSVFGSIGTLAKPLVMAAPRAEARFTLTATAAGDIRVRNPVGDLLVKSVRSERGSVEIQAEQSILDANTWSVDPEATAARVAAFVALGATDPTAYLADVAAYEAGITSRYSLFWSLRNSGDVVAGQLQIRDDAIPLWQMQAAASLGAETATDEQVRVYAADLYGQQVALFDTTMGAGWPGLPAFQAFDPDYRYQATQAQIDQFRDGRTVTEAELSVQLLATAFDNPPAGQSVAGAVNISGHDVRLVSRNGSVGVIDDPVTITAQQLTDVNLTEEQRTALALAGSPGDATQTADGLLLNVKRPIILDVRGRLDVDAQEGVIVAQKTGALAIGRVNAASGKVSIIADGSIVNADGETIDMWGNAIDFSRPGDWSFVGNAGQSLAPQGDLHIPDYADTVSATWLKSQVPTASFKATFIYEATAATNAGHGLAFVLQTSGTTAVGSSGSGLGYQGISGKKVAFLIDLRNSQARLDVNGKVQTTTVTELTLTNRPLYVTLVYDAARKSVTATISEQPEGEGGASKEMRFQSVDLQSTLGNAAWMGFTSATSRNYRATQTVSDFRFASGAAVPEQKVVFPAGTGQTPWSIVTTPGSSGTFTMNTGSEVPVLTFPAQTNIASAAWSPERVPVSTDFEVSFEYRYSGNATPGRGLAFVLQNSPDGTQAIGNAGTDLGYGAIKGPKVGYLLNIFSSPSFAVGTKFDTVGNTGSFNPVSLMNKDTWLKVTLAYDAENHLLTETVVAGTQTYSYRYTGVNLVDLLGGDTAFMGFTAGSANGSSASQEVKNFVYRSPQAPVFPQEGDPVWQLNGSIQSMASGVLVIPARANTATSTWFSRPVTTGSFEASFTYETAKPSKTGSSQDGFALVLHNSPDGLAAIGSAGKSLGYLGISGPKVGLLFDRGVPGVGFDSDPAGSSQTVSAPAKLDWSVGQPISVHLSYNATLKQITVTLSSGKNGESYTRTWDVDLADVLGSSAVMGITSGSGSSPAEIRVSNFTFRDTLGVRGSDDPASTSPAISLWSTSGDIGSSGDEVSVYGRFEAQAPNGQVHTNPPPAPKLLLKSDTGASSSDEVTNDSRLTVTTANSSAKTLYSSDGGRTWVSSLSTPTLREGLVRVLAVLVNARGQRSEATSLSFVLDTRAPAAPTASLAVGPRYFTKNPRLVLGRIEQGAIVQYSVNGGTWSTTYAPVEGLNVVRVRQLDAAGNASVPSRAKTFVLKTSVAPVVVTLLRDTGSSTVDGITRDGRLRLQGVERGARVSYSVDGGKTWRTRVVARLGVNTVLVRQIDVAGNVSKSTALTFTLLQATPWYKRVIGR